MQQKGKIELKKSMGIKKVDTKEFELPETTFIRDIDTKVFQGIVLQCLSQIEGIAPVEGNFIDNILGRSATEVSNGIHSEHDSHSQSVSIKIEVNIYYGISIPEKAEEIQSKVVEEITRLTGLRVSSIHIVFGNLIVGNQAGTTSPMFANEQTMKESSRQTSNEYADDF